MTMEKCAMCKQPMVCGHSLQLDNTRRLWRLCCLCTAEMMNKLDSELVPEP